MVTVCSVCSSSVDGSNALILPCESRFKGKPRYCKFNIEPNYRVSFEPIVSSVASISDRKSPFLSS